jgi:hypothetical protein
MTTWPSRTASEIDALYGEGWLWLTDEERYALLEATEGIVDGSEAIGYDQPWVRHLETARSKVIRSAPVAKQASP